MTKKKLSHREKKESIQEIIGWTPPAFHQASECYVSFKAFDPCFNKMRLKKIMLNHIKGKRNQRVYGEDLIKRLTLKLLEGWNPWIEESRPEEYALFSDVCDKYRTYLAKLTKEGGIKPGTKFNYEHKLSFMVKWVEKGKQITYIYQFNKKFVCDFLDYILVERNNTLRTRNNYIGWLKSFSSYLVERGYISRDPTEGISVSTKLGPKNRSVIPNDVLLKIKEYLEKENKHFLLACYILHYLFIRPHEMSFLKIKDVSREKKTLTLNGMHTKNGHDAIVTIPNHVIALMEDLNVFSAPPDFYLFGAKFRPGKNPTQTRNFSRFWVNNVKIVSLSGTKACFSIAAVGDFVSYSPTILQILCRHDIDAYLISWSLV